MKLLNKIKSWYLRNHSCSTHKKLIAWNYTPYPVITNVYQCKLCGTKWKELTSDECSFM